MVVFTMKIVLLRRVAESSYMDNKTTQNFTVKASNQPVAILSQLFLISFN